MSYYPDQWYYQVMFWNVGEATKTSCQHDKANQIEIMVRENHHRFSFTFEWPKQQLDAEKLMRMLQITYRTGGDSARLEVRQALGIRT